jgi:hypothetical protein
MNYAQCLLSTFQKIQLTHVVSYLKTKNKYVLNVGPVGAALGHYAILTQGSCGNKAA